MKYFYYFLILSFTFSGCTTTEDSSPSGSVDEDFKWIVPTEAISGSLNFFPLATDPQMIPAKAIDFISDNTRVAMIRIENEIRVYPYQFISSFEAVNDKINAIEFTMTYCPITKSGLIIDRKFKTNNFTIRASGYLFQDNVILIDEKSDTFWSQMLVKCVKGKYAGERINTFHYVETKWLTVKQFFPEAMVFTNTSIENKSTRSNSKKSDFVKGDLNYGILDLNTSLNESVYLYQLDDFAESTKLKTARISGKEIIIIGSEKNRYITSYINNSNANFKAVQNQFPIIMEDSNTNKWDVFGKAVSGPRKGDQLKSLPSFFALGWAWESFYDNVIIED